jgi:site-specific DNA-methyltransferase (adenine-specific)
MAATAGRWPPNVLLTCCGQAPHDPSCPVAALDRQSGERKAGGAKDCRGQEHGFMSPRQSTRNQEYESYGDTGGASRFFPVLAWDPATDVPFAYVPKASRAERNAGCAGLPERESDVFGDDEWGRRERNVKPSTNHHPTVKPVKLMEWLCQLVTPPGGTRLDPFLGSGTTGVAAIRLGYNFIGCEQEPEYIPIAQARMNHALAEQQRAPEASQAHLPILATLDNRTPACTHLATGPEPCACVDGHQERESA